MSRHHASSWSSSDTRKWKPIIAAALPLPCVDCGRIITEDTPLNHWQVGHIRALSQGGEATADNLGPSHSKASGRACNQIAGGRMGGLTKAAKTKASRRLPSW